MADRVIWRKPEEALPPCGELVNVIPPHGTQTQLIFDHNLWFLPDKSMYVYYVPVFWSAIE